MHRSHLVLSWRGRHPLYDVQRLAGIDELLQRARRAFLVLGQLFPVVYVVLVF